MGLSKVKEAVDDIRKGKMVIVVDEEHRENEGDLTIAAEKITPDVINFMAQHGRGLICMPMTRDRLDKLKIPLIYTLIFFYLAQVASYIESNQSPNSTTSLLTSI